MGERDVTVEIQLDGQVAVVTGGGDGIGGAISDVLAAAGAHVVVVDIDAEHAAARVDGITSGGGRAQAVVADVRDREQVAQIARVATDVAGHIDILVNNVGDYRP
ncbi:MAG: SDR family NAD(P)-dependent oxidoreductase, partial [Acidimicrobiia bacterium]|nr:SDR family NAD(P)-dependent oxidoreductase [Acidimicrobiia bacterium]